MQGKEFAERLLKPMDITVVKIILTQKKDKIDMLLRLIGQSFTMVGREHAEEVEIIYPPEVVKYLKCKGCFSGKEEEEPCFLMNKPPKIPLKEEEPANNPKRPTDKEQYELFRRVV